MLTHFPQAVPEIPVRDVDSAAAYYTTVLGFSHDWGNDAGGIGGISQGAATLPRPAVVATPRRPMRRKRRSAVFGWSFAVLLRQPLRPRSHWSGADSGGQMTRRP